MVNINVFYILVSLSCDIVIMPAKEGQQIIFLGLAILFKLIIFGLRFLLHLYLA